MHAQLQTCSSMGRLSDAAAQDKFAISHNLIKKIKKIGAQQRLLQGASTYAGAAGSDRTEESIHTDPVVALGAQAAVDAVAGMGDQYVVMHGLGGSVSQLRRDGRDYWAEYSLQALSAFAEGELYNDVQRPKPLPRAILYKLYLVAIGTGNLEDMAAAVLTHLTGQQRVKRMMGQQEDAADVIENMLDMRAGAADEAVLHCTLFFMSKEVLVRSGHVLSDVSSFPGRTSVQRATTLLTTHQSLLTNTTQTTNVF